MEALKANDEEEQVETAKYVDENGNLVDYEKPLESEEPKRGLHKVRSGSNLAEMKQQTGKDLDES